MKKMLLYGTVVLFSLSSCGDSFLDLKPTNQILEEEYYQTEDEIMQALVAAYQPLQWHHNPGKRLYLKAAPGVLPP